MSKEQKPPADRAEEKQQKTTAAVTELPESAALPDDAYCPSCGRFVGAYERCPYCQAAMQTRLGVKVVRRLAVAGAIIGLVLLWFAARAKVPPEITIGSIDVNNNMALVKVTGRVVSLRMSPEKNTFSLNVDDGSGRMSLGGFDKLRKFQEHFGDDFPQVGDVVSAVGNLSITEKWGASMFLSVPRRMEVVEKFKPEDRTIEAISPDDIGAVVAITVTVTDVREFPPNDPIGRSIKVRDNTGAMDLTVFNADYEKIADAAVKKQLITPGSRFIMQVLVDEYKGRLQLNLRNPGNAACLTYRGEADLSSLPAVQRHRESGKPVPISEITRESMDRKVTVEGTVETFKTFQPGTNVKIKDATGTISVWIKTVTMKHHPDKEAVLTPGTLLSVTGTVGAFKDEIQVQPGYHTDIVVKGGKGE